MAGKLPGRVGDSALIGCGTYAESNLGGVSCTGDGEAIIRVVLARRALETLKSVDDPGQACRVAVDVLVEEGRGQGGLILVDWKGRMGWAHSTPVMTGARVHVKLENLQMTGSFKERGAANLLAQLSTSERRRGVIAASAGNH